ncbi:MAG: peptidylprolyl isomerase [Elusimicrobia bacterium]|nr:peptidylprolyl isomerase [Elusimicrobiota bacterium]
MAWALVLLLAGACAPARESGTVRHGAVVKAHYTLLAGKKVLDTTAARGPLIYAHGSGQILAGLERRLEGAKAGEKRTVRVPPKEAFGPENPAAFIRVARASFTDPRQLALGTPVQGEIHGRPFQARVERVEGEAVVLNLNHPLAGKTLRFEVQVVDVLSSPGSGPPP